MHPPVILILAAGAASRMRGADKLLEPVAGVPQLARLARAALSTGWRVIVTLPPDRPARQAVLAGLAADRLVVPDAATGMSASIRAGVAAAAQAPRLMILPADLPELGAADLAQVIARSDQHPQAILRGTAEDGTPGHPVIFPADLFPDLARLTGDEGARAVLRAHAGRIVAVALRGQHATLDLDTPEAWAEWRAGHAPP